MAAMGSSLAAEPGADDAALADARAHALARAPAPVQRAIADFDFDLAEQQL